MENNRFATTIVVILVTLKIGVAANLAEATVTEAVGGSSTLSNETVDCPSVNAAEICPPYIYAIVMICIIVLLIVVIGIILSTCICYFRVYRPKKRSQRALQEPVNEDEVVKLTSASTSQDTERNDNESSEMCDLDVKIEKRNKVINEQEKETRDNVEIQRKSDEIRKNEASKKTNVKLQKHNEFSKVRDIHAEVKINKRDKVSSEQEIEIRCKVAIQEKSDEIQKLQEQNETLKTTIIQLKEQNEASKKTIIRLQEQSESSKISVLEVKITKLEKVRDEQAIKIRDLECEDEKKSDEIRKLKERDEASTKTITQLQVSLHDLQQHLYPKENSDYIQKPSLTHTFITDAGSQRREPINGMAILGRELFVSHENKSVIESYDSETFQSGHKLTIEAMSQPLDIASCKLANCLYIIFTEDNKSESRIMKLDPKGELLGEWSTGGERGRLSTCESNVIVCLFEKQMIKEFSGDGNLVDTVRLSPAIGINHPWHAIKVSSNHFAVCHGDVKDDVHRVCIVDVQGNIIKEIRQGMKQKLNVPMCLAEDSGRSILVADRENQKVRLLSCVLKRELSLIKKETGLDHYPVRICLDEANGRLFVAENKKEWKDGRILVFNIR